MKSIVITNAAFGAWSPAITDSAKAACAAARRAVNGRKETLENRLQELVLELLAAIVLVAIFMIVTEPANQADR